MATLVITKDMRLMIDPGVALAPSRYGLPPHPVEVEKMREMWLLISDNLADCTHVIVTHYHYDHHEPNAPELLVKKRVLVKHPSWKINFSQRRRASYFLSRIDEVGGTYEYADGIEIREGSTLVRISEPVPHGVNTKLGYVIMVSVDDGDRKFLYTSDVEGMSIGDQVNVVLREKPEILVIDGPMTYMLGYRYSHVDLERSVNNIVKVMRETPLEVIILEHHLMRDLDYKRKINQVFLEAEERGVEVLSAAEFEGKPVEMLEARRKDLYGLDESE
ncbi:MAG: hypothetical protein QFX33_04970 [Candidatus Nezhaarchaeota archaeon]|nr:hypothetical protein [Candidatus Nezhaarchaeota archaeon]